MGSSTSRSVSGDEGSVTASPVASVSASTASLAAVRGVPVQQHSLRETGGWRILSVYQNSPASSCHITPYFDYIVSADGCSLGVEESEFFDIIDEHRDRPLKLELFNPSTRHLREVTLTPQDWSGKGLLGLVIRFDDFDNFPSSVIHVLDVFPNSPAATAGLKAYDDYLLGTANVIFHGIDELDDVVQQAEVASSSGDERGCCISLYVYNVALNSVRKVHLRPNPDWGGQGSIGCDVSHGLLHSLPSTSQSPSPSQSAPPIEE